MTAVPTIVLVHGAWHRASCWDLVAQRLDASGIANVAVDNPSVAHAPADLVADADNVKHVLDQIDGPVVLVGHSYGGAVVTDAGSHPSVTHLVYLTAFALDDGESVIENNLTGGEDLKLGEALTFDGELVLLNSDRAAEFFYHDCEPGLAAEAISQLGPMSLAAMQGVPRTIAWRAKPATYVVCTDDQALPVALQQSNAKRVANSVELPTSHSPFLSRPDDVAELLVEIARGR